MEGLFFSLFDLLSSSPCILQASVMITCIISCSFGCFLIELFLSFRLLFSHFNFFFLFLSLFPSSLSPINPINSTSVAVSGKDFAIVAGDTRMSRGYNILTRYMPKTYQLFVSSLLFSPLKPSYSLLLRCFFLSEPQLQ
jgi:hypothetical protein